MSSYSKNTGYAVFSQLSGVQGLHTFEITTFERVSLFPRLSTLAKELP